jgi:hypothetical protein
MAVMMLQCQYVYVLGAVVSSLAPIGASRVLLQEERLSAALRLMGPMLGVCSYVMMFAHWHLSGYGAVAAPSRPPGGAWSKMLAGFVAKAGFVAEACNKVEMQSCCTGCHCLYA